MSTTDGYKFIFLCGLHRSGTSPLFRTLREHREISGFRDTGVPEDEGQHLQTVFEPAKTYGGPGRFGFATEAHLTEESVLVTQENAQRLFSEWSKHWDLSRPWLLEKSPSNLIRTRFLQAVFPNSYFVVLTRHPIAASLATRKWADATPESLIEHWLHCHRLFQMDRPHLRHVHIVKFEDLIQSTNREMEKIYSFLNLNPKLSEPLNPAANEPYFSEWRRLSDDAKGRAQVHQIVSKYEGLTRAQGYSLANFGATPTASLVSH